MRLMSPTEQLVVDQLAERGRVSDELLGRLRAERLSGASPVMGLSSSVVKDFLTLIASRADNALQNDVTMGGIIAVTLDECRRLLAETARANGMPNLDCLFGRDPEKEVVARLPSSLNERGRRTHGGRTRRQDVGSADPETSD